MKVTPAEALEYNCEMIRRIALAMARAVRARINSGDVMFHGNAADWLGGLALNRKDRGTAGDLIDYLERCDASMWLDFMAICGSSKRLSGQRRTASDLLKIATGRNYDEWMETERRIGRHPDYRY